MSDDLLQLRLAVAPNKAQELEDALWAQNAYSVTFVDGGDNPIFEPELGTTPLWANTHILALFAKDANQKQIKAAIAAILPSLDLQFSFITTKNWERAWLVDFKPMRFGQKLWIVPSTYTPPDSCAVNLALDPGLAFGTGTHPSTALCLRWLDENSQVLPNKQIIDYGCGSGVLAIAALLLGAKNALGIDIDPQALEASRSNAQRNNISDEQLTLNLADAPQMPKIKADILLANILADPLIELAPYLASLVKAQGSIVLAGIMAAQTAQITKAYSPYLASSINLSEQDGWVCLSFKVR